MLIKPNILSYICHFVAFCGLRGPISGTELPQRRGTEEAEAHREWGLGSDFRGARRVSAWRRRPGGGVGRRDAAQKNVLQIEALAPECRRESVSLGAPGNRPALFTAHRGGKGGGGPSQAKWEQGRVNARARSRVALRWVPRRLRGSLRARRTPLRGDGTRR